MGTFGGVCVSIGLVPIYLGYPINIVGTHDFDAVRGAVGTSLDVGVEKALGLEK